MGINYAIVFTSSLEKRSVDYFDIDIL